MVISTSVITTIAGTGLAGYSGDGGAATSAATMFPCGINLDSAGNVYFGDFIGYNVIRKVTVSTGIISTVAGTASTSGGYNGDNIQATSAQLNYPYDVVLDSADNLYICDYLNNRIRKVTVSTGLISTIIGDGSSSSTGDGSAATSATTYLPCHSRFDSAGNYYITECGGARVRKIVTITDAPTPTPTAFPSLSPSTVFIISTIAGSGATGGVSGSYSGDNGPATAATLNGPQAVALDSSGKWLTLVSSMIRSYSSLFTGNVYISDPNNGRIRKVTVSTGIITTFAGTGTGTYNGDGVAATSAAMYSFGITLDSSGRQNIVMLSLL